MTLHWTHIKKQLRMKILLGHYSGIFRVILGTAVSMTLMTLAAFSLSKDDKDFKGRKYYVWFFVFTMLFSGGLVPSYIIVTKVGLTNSIWALVLPGAVSAFNLILLLNFFRTSVPKSLEEAAYIDGAGHFRILFSIYLPIAIPALATCLPIYDGLSLEFLVRWYDLYDRR